MTLSFTIDRKFLRRSLARRMFRRWWLVLIGLALILPSVIGDLETGPLSGISIFGVAAVVILVLRYAVGWHRQARLIDDWVLRQGDVPVCYQFDEDSITVESVNGRSTLKWAAFRQLTITSFHLLLEFPREQGALTLPVNVVTPEIYEFISGRFSENGLRIKK